MAARLGGLEEQAEGLVLTLVHDPDLGLFLRNTAPHEQRLAPIGHRLALGVEVLGGDDEFVLAITLHGSNPRLGPRRGERRPPI